MDCRPFRCEIASWYDLVDIARKKSDRICRLKVYTLAAQLRPLFLRPSFHSVFFCVSWASASQYPSIIIICNPCKVSICPKASSLPNTVLMELRLCFRWLRPLFSLTPTQLLLSRLFNTVTHSVVVSTVGFHQSAAISRTSSCHLLLMALAHLMSHPPVSREYHTYTTWSAPRI